MLCVFGIQKMLENWENNRTLSTIGHDVQSIVHVMVGATGFEPTTSSTPRKRSTKLGYAPTQVGTWNIITKTDAVFKY